MIRSRVTFATIDAAATLAQRRSPATRFCCGQGRAGRATKSVMISSGTMASRASASAIAWRVAWRMLIRSIVSWSTTPTPTARACVWIRWKRTSRSAGRRSFESASPLMRRSGAMTTAAATTGPASGPRPASSTPATSETPVRQARAS